MDTIHLANAVIRLFLFIPILLLLEAVPCALGGEIEVLVGRALRDNPSITAARARVEQAYHSHEGLLGFFDPSLYAAGGTAERTRSVPGSTGYTSLRTDANELQGGVEMALEPGFYLSLGASERFLKDPDAAYSHLYQTLGGVRIRVPLGRDRGFREWDYDRSKALADYGAAIGDLLRVMQEVRHNVVLAYINVLEAKTQLAVTQEAARRFQALLDEAQELAKLKVVPEYQLFPAQMEVELRASEESSAVQLLETRLLNLGELVGAAEEVSVAADSEFLVTEANRPGDLVEITAEAAVRRQGVYQRILSQLSGVRALLRNAHEATRSTLDLNMGATWQGEDSTDFTGDGTYLSEEHFGGEVTLVWRRSLGFREERSEIRRLSARISELKGLLLDEEISIKSSLATYKNDLARSTERLRIVSNAMTAGVSALDAERERFRLGEGRSRNVLDAQKDVTTISQRQARAAADVLRARTNYAYVSGYVFDIGQAQAAPDSR